MSELASYFCILHTSRGNDVQAIAFAPVAEMHEFGAIGVDARRWDAVLIQPRGAGAHALPRVVCFRAAFAAGDPRERERDAMKRLGNADFWLASATPSHDWLFVDTRFISRDDALSIIKLHTQALGE